MEKEKFKEIPTGTGRESEPKETLPAIEVDNEVEWVNPDFGELPFDLKEGESTKLGIFLTPEPGKEKKPLNLKIMESHARSGLLGRVVFKDNQERLYRDVDLKGIGYVLRAWPAAVGEVEPRDSTTAEGIFNLARALKTKEMAEEFFEAGIRTERYIAIIKLNEIVDEKGKKVSIKEARKREMINPNQEPVIGLRALGTKFRIIDSDREKLEDARHLVAQELGIKEKDFSWEDYLNWFTETAGKNLGLMHKPGNEWYHSYLTEHNITLDCRIVDLDSVRGFYSLEEWKKEEMMIDDYYRLKEAILNTTHGLLNDMNKHADMNTADRVELRNIFNKAYKKALGYTPEFLAKEK